jgi:phosphate uptake regulator
MTVDDAGNITLGTDEVASIAFPVRCRIHADRCPDPRLIMRTIIGCYITGYNTFNVSTDTELTTEQILQVSMAVERLTGVTVVEQTEKHILIECMVQPPKFPLMSMIKRLFLQSSTMVEKMLESIMQTDSGALRDITSLEMDVDKLYRLILRLLLLGARDRDMAKQMGIEDSRHLLGNRAIAASLESVGDLSEELVNEFEAAGLLNGQKVRFNTETSTLLSMFSDLSASTSSCLFERDLNAASSALDSASVLQKKCWAGLKALQKKQQGAHGAAIEFSGAYSLLYSGMSNIAKEYELIVQVMMNRFIEKPSMKFPYLEIEETSL